MKQNHHFSDYLFDTILVLISIVIILLVAYPLYFVIIASISNPEAVLTGKVSFWPVGTNWDSYRMVFEESKIWVGYKNTLFYTILGTFINLTLTTLGAFCLSRKDMPLKKFFTFFILFTMMFSGGMIPIYLVVKGLQMTDTIWAMVIPNAIATYNLVVMKNYFENSIPEEIEEAARIDGCGDFRMLCSIVLPLSTPIIAVIVLFYAVGHWNAFFNAVIYLRDQSLYPLQIILREILLQNNLEMLVGETVGMYEKIMKGETMKYSVIIVSSLPVLLLYPFAQKYFVEGVMAGAVKG